MTDTLEVEGLKNALVLREALTGATVESENRLRELEALRHALREEERIRVKLEAVASEKEARIRQLEARVAELATESSANETAYSHQCHKTASFESEAEDLRRQFVAARHTLAEIGGARLEDWQALLERAETAEERIRHLEGRITLAEGDSGLFLCDRYDKAVCDAVEAVPDTLLHDWVDLNLSRSGRLTVIATAELARREARRGR